MLEKKGANQLKKKNEDSSILVLQKVALSFGKQLNSLNYIITATHTIAGPYSTS